MIRILLEATLYTLFCAGLGVFIHVTFAGVL